MGRRRIQIRRIESKEARQACFSNRRAGLFNKARELSILCGVHVAVVVFSPAGKALSFGHTSVEGVLGRFLGPALPPPVAPTGAGMAGGNERTSLPELNKKHDEQRAQLEVQRALRERVEQRMAAARAENDRVSAWVDIDVRQMMEGDLVAYGAALMCVYETVRARADQVLRDALAVGSSRTRVPTPPLPQFDDGHGYVDDFGLFSGGGFEVGQFGDGGFEVGQSSGTAHGGDGMQQQQRMVLPEPSTFGGGEEMPPPSFFGPPPY